jgi:hypothetical protein
MESANKGRLYRSLAAVAETVPSIAGLPLGLTSIDRLTGGLRPRKLNLFVGFSSHGKTSLMMSTVARNLDKRCLFVSADDTDDVLLTKLLAMHYQCSTDDVEAAGPVWRRQAVELNFPNIIIATPQSGSLYSLDELRWLYDMASEDLGGPVELVAFDYLSLLALRGGDSDNGALNTRAKAIALKEVIRATPEAVWMVGQQCNRQAGANCPALLLTHVEYGGIQETDGVMIGCRRRIDTTTLTDHQLWEEERCPTTHISVMKNKITGKRSPNPVGVPYAIDPVSGIIRELTAEDRPTASQHHSGIAGSVRFNDVPDWTQRDALQAAT